MQIDKSLIKDPRMARRVSDEVEIHWQLRHPCILELYNYFEDAENVYLVMELCKNGELFNYLRKRPLPMSEPEARGVLEQLVRGLQYLHSNNILHRDLKLSNLLLTQSYDLKIADFGLAAKLFDPSGEQKTMCGTPNYISPEIVSRLPYGLEADLWSLGCMMVTILTKIPPFENAFRAVFVADLETNRNQDPKRRLPLAKVIQHPFFDPSKPRLRDRQDQLKQFTTERLKPMKKATKLCTIEILPSGELLLDFTGDKALYIISSDSELISFYQRDGFSLNPRAPSARQYSRRALPSSFASRFSYAARVIELIRAKTPKVCPGSPCWQPYH
eukprot:jgi/Hompol1/4059/HPOL_003454-RA